MRNMSTDIIIAKSRLKSNNYRCPRCQTGRLFVENGVDYVEAVCCNCSHRIDLECQPMPLVKSEELV